MMKGRHRSVHFFLVLALIAGVVPKPALAGDGANAKFVRPQARDVFGPIGTVFSLGAISINGRSANGEQPIWNGDALHVSDNATAQVSVDSVGTVALARKTSARLAVRLARDTDHETFVLIVSLRTGTANVRLFEAASAYVEVGGSAFTARKGSSFRTEIRDSRAGVDALSGSLETEPGIFVQPYFVDVYRYDVAKKRPARSLRNRRFHARPNSRNDLAGRSTTEPTVDKPKRVTSDLVVRVGLGGYAAEETAQHVGRREPAEGRTLKFEIEKPDVGTLVADSGRGPSVTGITDKDGFARVTFEAGPRKGSTRFTVEDVTPMRADQEKRYNWWGEIVVEKGFWQKWRNTVIVGAIAAVVGTIIITHRDKPLLQEPPPVIP